jgi:integrase
MSETFFIRRLQEKLAEQDLAPGTVERTLIDTRQFCDWYRGTTGQELDPDAPALVSVDLAEYRSHLMRRDLRPNTIHRKFYSLRKALFTVAPEQAVSLRWPKLPKIQMNAPSGFTRAERNAIIRAATTKLNARDGAVVMLLLMTGGRASSIATARLSGLQMGPRSGSITYWGKGNKEITVPLNVEAREAVTRWLAVRPKADHDFIFTAVRHPFEPISRWVVHSIWGKTLARHVPRELAGKLKGPHSARHALARLLLSGDEGRWNPVPASDVAALLGHSSVKTTVGIYCRPSPENLQAAVDRIAGDHGEGER